MWGEDFPRTAKVTRSRAPDPLGDVAADGAGGVTLALRSAAAHSRSVSIHLDHVDRVADQRLISQSLDALLLSRAIEMLRHRGSIEQVVRNQPARVGGRLRTNGDGVVIVQLGIVRVGFAAGLDVTGDDVLHIEG